MKIAAAVAAVMLSAAASATVVDFNVLNSANPYTFISNGYSENGLTFLVATSESFYHWGVGSPYNSDPTGSTLSENYNGDPITVMKTGGGSFTLNSIDLADVYNNGTAATINFSWVDGTGAHSTSLTTDTLVGAQTFAFNLAGVTSFSLYGTNDWLQMDNIRYNATTAVPEAGNLAMMLAGLAAVGAALRRRKA